MKAALLLLLLATAAIPGAGRKQLFNGKDLDGWKMVGPGRFVVENGLLKTEGGMGLLWYEGQKFGDCTIRVVFKTTAERDNSGLYIRLPEQPKDPWYAVHNGYEVQIADGGDPFHCTGSIYSLAPSSAVATQGGEWRTMIITLAGEKISVELDGKQVSKLDLTSPDLPKRTQWHEPKREPKRPQVGYLGLQNHDPGDVVWFKEVSVRLLPAARAK